MKSGCALTRRRFIGAGLAAGGSVVFYMSAGALPAGTSRRASIDLNSWIRIAPDGAVTAYCRTTELGQGAHTSLALIVAEELQMDGSAVAVEMAPVSEQYMDKTQGEGAGYYVTWGSLSSRDMDTNMRRMAATVRILLVQAAAKQWAVPEQECSADGGVVRHVSGRTLTYAAVASVAAALPIPQNVEPKPRAKWQRLGRSMARIDIPAKTDGSAIYGVDVKRPNLLVATIMQCPIFGGTLRSVDASTVERLPGVKKVVSLENAVAVVADGYWSAKKSLHALRPVWNEGPHKPEDSSVQSAKLRVAAQSPGRLFVLTGAKEIEQRAAHEQGMARGEQHLDAIYEVPFLAHAPLEPMNATAHVMRDRAELWVPTQYQSMVREVVAEILGLPRDKVLVHTTAVGGGFGRRTEIDYAIQAAQIARHMEQPVKLIWSREEDMSRGYFRPKTTIQLKAALDAQGNPTAFAFTAACPSIMDYSIERRNGAPQSEIDEAGLANARDWPYAIPGRMVELVLTDLGVPLTWMRSVGSAASVFALECFLDEMAAAAKIDSVAYRRQLLRNRPRELAVLEKAALLAGWDIPAMPGRHRGFALSISNGSVVAQVVEIEVNSQRAVKLHRIHCVVDCGIAYNPDAVVAQMEGGIIFGLTGALFGEITLKNGAVLQKNFDSYPLLTLAQTPKIEVAILQSDAPVGGVGEEAVPPVGAAVANAIFSATGQRLRSMPFMRDGFTLADAR